MKYAGSFPALSQTKRFIIVLWDAGYLSVEILFTHMAMFMVNLDLNAVNNHILLISEKKQEGHKIYKYMYFEISQRQIKDKCKLRFLNIYASKIK